MNGSTLAFINTHGHSTISRDLASQDSEHFIVCAIVVDQADDAQLTSALAQIQQQYGATDALVPDDCSEDTLTHTLDRLLNLPFSCYLIAIDKTALSRDSGLKAPDALLKVANKLLYKQLFESFSSIQVFADPRSDADFQSSFADYLNHHHEPDLFWDSALHRMPRQANLFMQLAHFLANTIAKVYANDSDSLALIDAYRALLTANALDLKEWPTQYQSHFSPARASQEYDQFIHAHALSKAEAFIETQQTSRDEGVRLQTCVLRHLVFHSRLSTNETYISTHRIIEHLARCGFTGITEQAIRSQIISKLRDKDVIIASCNRGYKLPSSHRDLHDFFERVNSQVLPLLERVNKARNSYMHASEDKVDLLKGPKYPELVKFLHVLNQ